MSTSDSKVVVDHVSDLSSSKKLFLQSDLLLEVWILDDLVQSRSHSRIKHLKILEILTSIDHEDFNSATESNISTSLTHNVASKGKSEQELTWVFNLIFQYENDEGVENQMNWSSDICSLCFTAIELCGISAGRKEFMVDGLLADIGIGPKSFFTSRVRSPCTYLHWNRTCGTWIRKVKNSLIAKNVSLCFRQIPCMGWLLRWRLNIDCGLGMTAGWDCESVKNSTVIRFCISKFSWIIHAIHPLLQLLYLWSELLYRIMTFSQFL